MSKRTTPQQRRVFYESHLRGETYAEIAERLAVSLECVRYWCRRQRDGGMCHTTYSRQPAGLLGRFDPKVRYWILRLRLEHPRWGPNRIRARLAKLPSLHGLTLPSEAEIGRYLHQWPRFRRRRRSKPVVERPHQPTEVHQRWQIDFKLGIPLANGQQVNLHTIRDPVGEACMGACLFLAGRVGHRPPAVTASQVRAVLRTSFARWGTLPDEVQTDGEAVLMGRLHETFPSPCTLWLRGLGIAQLRIRPGKPTDNAEVERCHRTVTDYGIVGQEDLDVAPLQQALDQAVYELTFELPSRAEGCQGRPPIVAHPELLQPRRPFQPEHELALFDLQRVDAYLATFTWERLVGKTGQITLGGRHERYTVGRAYKGQQVLVRFDPADRHFVFYPVDAPDQEIGRRPARHLGVSDLTGLEVWPTGLGPQQLALPLCFSQGVSC